MLTEGLADPGEHVAAHLGGLDEITSALDLVVHVRRFEDGVRRIACLGHPHAPTAQATQPTSDLSRFSGVCCAQLAQLLS